MASVQGAFFGSNLHAARIETLIAAHVPKKHIKDVADVYDSKWWDYRRLSPGHSYLLFAHHYYRSFRNSARTFLAYRARQQGFAAPKHAAAIVGIGEVQYKPQEIFDRDARHITGMWNAMLTCDALGLPYDQFCSLGNQIAIDTAWQRLPKPSQLYSEKLGAQILDRWMKLNESRLFTAKHPIYDLEHDAGLKAQQDYRAWLVERIERHDNPVIALADVVYRRPQLDEATAAAQFPANLMKRARLLAA